MLVSVFSGSAQDGTKDYNSSVKTEVCYFHATARCMTCQTLEERAKENLQDLYPEQWKAGTITFQKANLKDNERDALAEKSEVSGQTLLLAGPSLSLLNRLVIRGIVGTQKTMVYVSLVIVMAALSGMLNGMFWYPVFSACAES